MQSPMGSQGRQSTHRGDGVRTYTVRADGTSEPELPRSNDLGRSRILFVPMANACVGTGGEAIPLTWNALRHVGSDAQKERLNRLRIAYVSSLVDAVRLQCQTRDELGCRIDAVGTDYRSATSASDADLNFKFDPAKTDGIQGIRWTDAIQRLYGALRAFHGARFPDTSMADLFDVNVYASDFVSPVHVTCTGAGDGTCLRSSCSQRSWACLRLAEVLRPRADAAGADPRRSAFAAWFESAAGADFATGVLAPAVAKLQDVRRIEEESPRDSLTYATMVGRAFSAARDRPDDAEDAAESFSRSKLYERDTYRSVGAFLHVVGGYRSMHPSLYVDSALDNLGFLLENLLEDKVLGCIEVPLEHRLLRVAKYLGRTCDALILSLGDDTGTAEAVGHLRDVQAVCKSLNEARKSAHGRGHGGDQAEKDLVSSLKQLIAPESVWSNSTGRSEESKWLAAVGVAFLRSFPYGHLCQMEPRRTRRTRRTLRTR